MELTPTNRIVVMGVAGAGKSTVGSLLAARLQLPFAEGDLFHAAASIAKMASGASLNDADRGPWLASIGEWLAAQASGGVASCSALKRHYRDQLRAIAPDTVFVHLVGDEELVRARMSRRSEHFMPESLVGSQYDALEPLDPDESGVTVDVSSSVDELVSAIVADLGLSALTTDHD